MAVLLSAPERLSLSRLALRPPASNDVVVDVEWTSVSTGTERLLWTGRMPDFPGMGYPLVPGYEAVGRVVEAGADTAVPLGTRVFAPGAHCFPDAKCLFGAAASRLTVSADRVAALPDAVEHEGVLLALAATAYHALDPARDAWPELIVGHGALGRLLARVCVAHGHQPTVWEISAARADGAQGYAVVHPDADPRRDYARMCDASGDPAVLDALVQRAAPGAEIVLAGFYEDRVSFAFAPAFMKEARLRVAAQWTPADLKAVRDLVAQGRLSLQGLITQHRAAEDAPDAYVTAFEDPACLKMVLDWRSMA